MLELIKAYINKNDLFIPSSRLLIAVSGGVDSMVCLNVLYQLGYSCGVAHCNFQLRGSESDKDEALVESISAQLQIPFYSQSFNTKEFANENGISIQMAARDLRYSWFESLRISKKYDYIILAHHGDDSVETVLINMARGTGLKGLIGIQAKSGNIRRPLLSINRQSILSYADNNDVSFREDSSNKKTDYTRNRIRHIIVPEFERINPSFSQTVLSNIEHLKEEQEVLNQKYADVKSDIVRYEQDDIVLSIKKLKELQHIQWFLYRFLSDFGFNNDNISSMITGLSKSAGKQFFAKEYTLIIDREYIFLTLRHPTIENEYTLDIAVKSISIPISLELSKIPFSKYKLSPNPDIANIDYQKITFPLTLRRWIPGDYFHPLGMNKAKKLSDFFIDEKIPRHRKEKVWILCSGEDIVWIIGLRMDNRYKITNTTSTVLQISLSR